MAGGVCGRGVCVAGGDPGRYYEIRSMSGRYASYWNVFLFTTGIPRNYLWLFSTFN